jgi:D-proline reductase (dithiol) PrdB
MTVDSFKFLPRLVAFFYQATEREPQHPIPWTPLPRPISECTFSLVTSGGLYDKETQNPFDLEREITEPTWGDPTYRTLSSDIIQTQVGVSHLHLNTEDILKDFNILLPIQRFKELEEEGVIGALARQVYSFMGFQGYPPDTTAWESTYGPQVAEKLKDENVDCVLLTPA